MCLEISEDFFFFCFFFIITLTLSCRYNPEKHRAAIFCEKVLDVRGAPRWCFWQRIWEFPTEGRERPLENEDNLKIPPAFGGENQKPGREDLQGRL